MTGAAEDCDAAARVRDAMTYLKAAEDASGATALEEAGQLIEILGTRSVAEALLMIAAVAMTCEAEALAAVKAAERAVRDVFVLRCRAVCKPGDREAFLATAEEAFPQGHWDREVRSQILMAVSKDAKKKPDTFLSNNQLATARRGRSRKRREKHHRDTSAATLSPAARKSSVPAPRTASVSHFDSWKREPRYVTLGVNRLQLAIRACHQGMTPP